MRLALMFTILILAGFLAWRLYADRTGKQLRSSDGPLSPEERADVHAALAAKGKDPWIMRNKGIGAVSLKSGGLLTETFDYLDAFEAHTALTIHDEKPLFTDDYDQQDGKADAISGDLERHLLNTLPFPFRAISGENRVDVVTLADGGNTAYVFVVDKERGRFLVPLQDHGVFYYDVPEVLRTLEAFLGARSDTLAPLIWLERDDGFFMFVIQHTR